MSQAPLPSDNPFAPPPVMATPEGRGNLPRAYQIASRQRTVLICILVQLVLMVANIGLKSGGPAAAQLAVSIALLCTVVVSAVAVFSLAMEVFGVGVGILLGILTLVPCVGLIMLLIVNGRATSLLRNAGYHVGLMGADLSQFEGRGA